MELISRARGLLILLCGVVCVLPGALMTAGAQFGPIANPAQAPQARSQQELDDYLEITLTGDLRDRVKRTESFATTYPHSELLALAYQFELDALRGLNDVTGAIAAGEKAIVASPHNVKILLTLATVIANSPSDFPNRTALLRKAQQYAREAADGIESARPSRQIRAEDWQSEKQGEERQAHETQGVLALGLGEADVAVREFEAAIESTPQPEGAQFFRLGLAEASAGQTASAEKNLSHAARLGPESVRALATGELAKLTDSGRSSH